MRQCSKWDESHRVKEGTLQSAKMTHNWNSGNRSHNVVLQSLASKLWGMNCDLCSEIQNTFWIEKFWRIWCELNACFFVLFFNATYTLSRCHWKMVQNCALQLNRSTAGESDPCWALASCLDVAQPLIINHARGRPEKLSIVLYVWDTLGHHAVEHYASATVSEWRVF